MLQRNPEVTAATMSKEDYDDAIMRWLPESLRKKLVPEYDYDLCFSGGENDISINADRSTDKLRSSTLNSKKNR